ncbi:DUF2062 domain-containing protein [Gammaproteobacteria bacterium AB-CW1]|uniref:DUF2062 domain-containing protein n=1 Tax=Natronospira elongata TaxID=3110268 RepID=A0AAP6JHE8_9GAMM|nr:DUF2062 domain-containing protein [Gammaproteobacteria bacterium AB-CW1]
MPRRFFKHYLPRRETLARSRLLRPFAALLSDPGLWALSRRSTAKGFGVGVFAAWLPIPFQTLVVLGLTAWMRVNLPVAVLASFISNPLTMGPMMLAGYLLGSLMLRMPPRENLEFGLEMIWQEIERIGAPLLLGCLTLGLLTALLSATIINVAWRVSLMRFYRSRRARRRMMGIRFRRPRQLRRAGLKRRLPKP